MQWLTSGPDGYPAAPAASQGPCGPSAAAPSFPTYHSTVAPKLTSRRGGKLAGRAGRGDGRGRAGLDARRHSSIRPPQRPEPRGAAGHPHRALGMCKVINHNINCNSTISSMHTTAAAKFPRFSHVCHATYTRIDMELLGHGCARKLNSHSLHTWATEDMLRVMSRVRFGHVRLSSCVRTTHSETSKLVQFRKHMLRPAASFTLQQKHTPRP